METKIYEAKDIETFKPSNTFPGDTWLGLRFKGSKITINGAWKKSVYNRMRRKTEKFYVSDTFAGEFKTIKELKERVAIFINQSR